MRILITNDDGVHAPGINALYNELRRHHDVILFAPDREQSASSHSLTLNRPLRISRIKNDYFACDGTPTDSVMLGVLKVMKNKRPDMVVSGINHGANMGEDIIYSGTVAAAIEGSQFDIPSVAVSMAHSTPDSDFKGAARFVRRFIKLHESLEVEPTTIFNLNFPGEVTGGFKKYRFTFLGSRKFDDIIVEKTDPREQKYYWIAGTATWKDQEGADINAIRDGEVSITPIQLQFTDHETLAKLQSARIKLPR